MGDVYGPSQLPPDIMGALANRIITLAEGRVDVPMPYLRTLADASGAAFSKWLLAMPAAMHRSATPKAAWHLARVGATQAQDCGTCVQVVVNDALREGVRPETLRAAVDGREEALTDEELLALGFGRAVSSQDPDVLGVGRARRDGLWAPSHIELAMAVAMCQIFPVIKRGMGLAVACSLVTVEV